MPRLMRSCAECSNELTRCIKILPRPRRKSSQDHGPEGKMVRLKGRVEEAVKIATLQPSGWTWQQIHCRAAANEKQNLLECDEVGLSL
jgi:hypothetical protein